MKKAWLFLAATGLLCAAEGSFERTLKTDGPVDLVEPGPIRNPYFRQVIEQTQVVLYEAP